MTDWSSGDIVANGITLHYQRTGGAKPPLVLAHGLTDNGICWSPVVQRLAQDYDCILVDARGHGKSTALAQGYTNAEHAADYAGLIRALNLVKPVMLGHSMGAATAAYLAAQYPDLVRAILLEDPPWRLQAEQSTPAQQAAAAEEWRARTITHRTLSHATLIEEGRENNPKWSSGELEPWAIAKQQVSPNALNYVSEASAPWWEYVPRIACPALLITADVTAGAIVSQASAQAAVALNPNIRVAHVPDAGHSIRRENLEPYVRVVRDFLAEMFNHS